MIPGGVHRLISAASARDVSPFRVMPPVHEIGIPSVGAGREVVGELLAFPLCADDGSRRGLEASHGLDGHFQHGRVRPQRH